MANKRVAHLKKIYPQAVRKKPIVLSTEESALADKSEAKVAAAPPRYTLRTVNSSTLILSSFLVGAIGVAVYYYYQFSNTREVRERREITAIVKTVGKLADLPQGEMPTLATVTNKEKLDNQPFFQRAENGDKILIYQTSGRAILYRPATGKVIDMTTLDLSASVSPTPTKESTSGEVAQTDTLPTAPTVAAATDVASDEQNSTATMETPLPPARIALYNGSTSVGVTNEFEVAILKQYPEMKIVAKTRAAKRNYTGITVVAINTAYAVQATDLATFLEGEVGELPANEKTPAEADLLVIVGND